MKSGIITVLSFAIAMMLLFIGVTVYGREERTKRLNSSLEYSITNALKSLTKEGEGKTSNNEELADRLYEIFYREMGTSEDITLQIIDIDAQKGLLSAKASWKYQHLNGNIGTITASSIAIVDKFEDDTEEETEEEIQYANVEIQISENNDFTEGNYDVIKQKLALNKEYCITGDESETFTSSKEELALSEEVGYTTVFVILEAPLEEDGTVSLLRDIEDGETSYTEIAHCLGTNEASLTDIDIELTKSEFLKEMEEQGYNIGGMNASARKTYADMFNEQYGTARGCELTADSLLELYNESSGDHTGFTSYTFEEGKTAYRPLRASKYVFRQYRIKTFRFSSM